MEEESRIKLPKFGIETLELVSKSEMSLSSMREAAAAPWLLAGLLLGLPMLNRWVPPAKEPTMTMWVSTVMPNSLMSELMLSNVWFSWLRENEPLRQPVRIEMRP